ncbi:MAG: pilus assembly protein PilC, partial [Acidobacteria bacterium 37-65-4]
MPQFEWTGRKRTGETITGAMTADNKDGVVAALRRQQIVAVKIKEKGKELALPKFGGGVGTKDLAIFTRQFSVMIDAGLPVVQCLEILGSQQQNKAFQRVLLDVREDVEAGSSL